MKKGIYPKISVLTPSFNSGKYLERAIQSVLNQDYDNWEHIVVDGGSTDNTLKILEKYPHLKWISEPDQGQSDAMNKAFQMSSGNIVGYLNADDYYEPDVFKNIVDYFSYSKRTDILFGQIQVVKGSDLSINSPQIEYKKIVLHFKYGYSNNPVGYFYRREVQESFGLFPLNIHFTMDYYFLLFALKNFKANALPVTLGNFYFSEYNKTQTINPIQMCRNTALKFFLKYDWVQLVRYIYYYTLFRVNNYLKAKRIEK